MKIAVVGAGAMGGLLAARFALAGEAVTAVDKGAHLEAMQRNGLKLINPDATEAVAKLARAVGSCEEAGPHDVVFLAVKANLYATLASSLRTMFHDHTAVVPIQNGLPWWYFQNFRGPHSGYRLQNADPDGVIERNIETRRIVGCVVYPAGEVIAPGVVKHLEGDRFPIGELDGRTTDRAQKISELFTRAGFKSPILEDIRSEIWLKLWGNMSFNPISALTHATLVDICQEPATRDLAADMMREAQAIAEKLGVNFRVPLEKRIAGAEKVGRHKTSTLQDVEAGRSVEIDALIGAVIELGQLTATPTPHVSAVYALMKLLQKTMQDERGRIVMMPLAA